MNNIVRRRQSGQLSGLEGRHPLGRGVWLPALVDDVPGLDGVASDPEAPIVGGDHPAQSGKAALARAVPGQPAGSHRSRRGTDVDDGAAADHQHLRDGVFAHRAPGPSD